MNGTIRPGRPADATALTELALRSKHWWHDPEPWFSVWKPELTVTPEYFASHTVFVAERVGGRPIGFCSVASVREPFWSGNVFIQEGMWLHHLFVNPPSIGTGVGTALLVCARRTARAAGAARLLVFSDPHAAGFYKKMGATLLRYSPSSIEGRPIPLFSLPTCPDGKKPSGRSAARAAQP